MALVNISTEHLGDFETSLREKRLPALVVLNGRPYPDPCPDPSEPASRRTPLRAGRRLRHR